MVNDVRGLAICGRGSLYSFQKGRFVCAKERNFTKLTDQKHLSSALLQHAFFVLLGQEFGEKLSI